MIHRLCLDFVPHPYNVRRAYKEYWSELSDQHLINIRFDYAPVAEGLYQDGARQDIPGTPISELSSGSFLYR